MRYTDSMGNEREINVQKWGAFLPFSEEMLMDHGLIEDTRPVYVPSRWQRVKNARAAWSHSVRMKIASWIAGFDVEEEHWD